MEKLLEIILKQIKNPIIFWIIVFFAGSVLIGIIIYKFVTPILNSNKLFHVFMDNKHKNSYRFMEFLGKILKSFIISLIALIVTFLFIGGKVWNESNEKNYPRAEEIKTKEPPTNSTEKNNDNTFNKEKNSNNNSNEEKTFNQLVVELILLVVIMFFFYFIISVYAVFSLANFYNKTKNPYYILNTGNIKSVSLNKKVFIDSKLKDDQYLCFYNDEKNERVDMLLPLSSIVGEKIYTVKETKILYQHILDTFRSVGDSLTSHKKAHWAIWSVMTLVISIMAYHVSALQNGIPFNRGWTVLKSLVSIYGAFILIPTFVYIIFIILRLCSRGSQKKVRKTRNKKRKKQVKTNTSK